MLFGVSVIICCYNSSTRIGPTLEHLAQQTVSGLLNWEVVLVDNCSVDNTLDEAVSLWNKLGNPAPLVICQEETPGLSYARKKGVQVAQFETIVFCDDDNWLDANYLLYANQELGNNPTVGIMGGWSKAFFKSQVPPEFESIQFSFAVGKPHQNSKDITDGWQVWGAGMVTRKSLLTKVFDSSFPFLCSDRKGSRLLSGGDDEICSRAIILGFNLYFCESLFFTHSIAPERLLPINIVKLKDGFEASSRVLKRYQFCIRGLWAYQHRDRFHAVISAAKSLVCILMGNWLYARCHLDSGLFALNISNFQDRISRSIFSFARQNGRFFRYPR